MKELIEGCFLVYQILAPINIQFLENIHTIRIIKYTYLIFRKLPIKYKDEIITRILYQFKGLPETGLNDMPFARVYKSISLERGKKKNP